MLAEDDKVVSCKLKSENSAARLDHGVEPEGVEVVVEERDGALVVSALELDQFGVGATVVAAVPTRTRTRVLDAAKALHSLLLLPPGSLQAVLHPHRLRLTRVRGPGSSRRTPFVS